MEDLNLERLRTYAIQERYRNPYYNLLSTFIDGLLQTGVLSKINTTDYLFYPKYLWQEDKNIELYFISNKNITKCTYNADADIHIETRFCTDISKINLLDMNPDKKEIQLEIIFKNNDQIVFSSSDTNNSWKYKFFNAIMDVYKILS